MVLLIIGLMTSVAMLSISMGEKDPARTAARRLQSLIGLAHEEAQMQGRNLALGLWRHGWRFYELGSDEHWQPVKNERALRPRTLAHDLMLQLQLQGIDVVLSSGHKTRPQVFLLSSGEMQPFLITVDQNGIAHEHLSGDALGQLTLSKVRHAQ